MNNCNDYKSITKFGKMAPSAINNPITYCINDTIDPYFLHGRDYLNNGGQDCAPCQWFLSDYCAQGWDGYCELASKNTQIRFGSVMNFNDVNHNLEMTSGEILIRNTAIRKYLIEMKGGKKIFEPFDPTVADSPMVSKWVPDGNYLGIPMTPVYSVDPPTIDTDAVMNKILMKPAIAKDVLIGIYKTTKARGQLNQLKNTNLGKFFGLNKHIFN